MLFSKEIIIPVSRTKASPYEQTIKVSKGVVQRVWVLINVPSAWACGVQIWYSESQMWPTSRTEWISGGQVGVVFDEWMKIDGPPLNFKVKAYNDDEVNTHKVWVALSVLRPTTTSDFKQFLSLFEAQE